MLRGQRRLAWVGAGSAYVTLLLVQALPGGAPAPGVAQAAGIAAWVLVVLLAGEGLRIRAERGAEAARSRAEQERRRASEQRLQEALTNAARHSAAAQATALITYRTSALTVQVNNQTADAGTPGVEGTGNGIAGMRERVTALGGEFSAGVPPGSREFRVRASFPLETLSPETLPAEAT